MTSYLRWRQHFVLMTSNVLKCIGKWRLTSKNDVTMSDFHQTCRKCLSYQYVTCVQIWSHLKMFWARSAHFSAIFTIWKILYIFYLPPTKVAKKNFYTCYGANFFRKHAKLIYIKSQKTAGLRPAPIFRKFTKCCRGGNIAPPIGNRVKIITKT